MSGGLGFLSQGSYHEPIEIQVVFTCSLQIPICLGYFMQPCTLTRQSLPAITQLRALSKTTDPFKNAEKNSKNCKSQQLAKQIKRTSVTKQHNFFSVKKN